MVILTKLNGKEIMLNDALIEAVSETPDTVITMSNGHSYIVQESIEEIFRRIVGFNRASRARTRDDRREDRS
ncbi:MAG: flagellar FlbD family protein [Ruminiclostridium sp.]|nr:flagellar FlbD family protein [Ruminiclostridium sp.]